VRLKALVVWDILFMRDFLEVSSEEAKVLQKEHPLLQPAASGGLGSTLCELLLLTCSWVCVYQQVQELISSRNFYSSTIWFFGLIPHCFTPRSSGLCNFCNPVAVQSVL